MGAILPRHVAIIMDGNGRWAERRGLARHAGHREGVPVVRMCVEECVRHGIGALTLFAFSSENWGRPEAEVANLMTLFFDALEREVDDLDRNGVRLRVIGDRHALSVRLQGRVADAERRTAGNTRLALQIAVSYGGRWDIVQAARRLAAEVGAGSLRAADIDETRFGGALALGDVPDPDLFIRTGGERRISNFLLWNLAYTELWFTDALWPDFDAAALGAALEDYAGRKRRFGRA
ncbi:MAG: Ditrans,polycis-undecaprenyl-diphosphate synthase ((2E,6E)-farnesyl-diphosphate specific) [Steroidobacteraceae bacterium]|nr:Ditrans,polycis-undecaprenyl-diphosphate synthase ((2E,6E)-farnesyl-diphosphate specific) [Steroidobacteraceae bacterium]